MGAGNQWVTKHDRSSLRVLGTVGEPINPVAWQWYHEVSARSPMLSSGLANSSKHSGLSFDGLHTVMPQHVWTHCKSF